MFIVYIVVLPLSHYSDPACCHLPLANASYALIYANEVHEYIRRRLMNISDAPLTATRTSNVERRGNGSYLQAGERAARLTTRSTTTTVTLTLDTCVETRLNSDVRQFRRKSSTVQFSYATHN